MTHDFKKALEQFGYRPEYSYEYRNELQAALKLASAVQEGRFDNMVITESGLFENGSTLRPIKRSDVWSEIDGM